MEEIGGMLMLDIDDFKSINDHMGHIAGDEALWETADLLRRVLGKEKTFLARYGGDEFAVIGAWEDAQAAGAAIAAIEQEVRIFNATAKRAIGFPSASDMRCGTRRGRRSL